MITYDAIAELAPSADTLAKARGVSHARKRWLQLEGNGKILWGIYATGNQQHPYRVAADLQQAKFHCNCPSKKRPCKHSLALLFLLFRTSDHFQVNYDLPAWVDRWRALESAEELPVPTTSSTDIDRKANTEEKRRLSIESGVVELKRWLENLLETGLAAVESYDETFWEDFAARMVDAKMGSIARRIRMMGEWKTVTHFPDHLLREIADLYLFTQGVDRLYQLPEQLQREVWTTAGVNIKKEEVLQQGKAVEDHWLVLGIQEGTEENLNYRRTWLIGEQSGRMALLLDYVWGNRGYEQQWVVGNTRLGTLVFYPGSYPLRALVKVIRPATQAFQQLHAYPDFAAFTESYAQAIGKNPWLMAFPCLLDAVIPSVIDGKFVLIDATRHVVPLAIEDEQGWTMVAISGGQPLTLFGEWNGDKMTVLSLFQAGRLIRLYHK